MVLKTEEDKRMAAKLQLQVDLFLKKKAGKVRHMRPASDGSSLVVVRKCSSQN
ncbi:MAG: hypothetical protein HGA36_01860 [Candidatus Moranbacteria bacterium]|nr:hypothetical protein [Candidatus Moranbacteria bacterium]